MKFLRPFLLFLAFIAINFFPALSSNSLPAKMTICCVLLLLIDLEGRKRMGTTAKLYMAWLIWAGIGSFLSNWSVMAVDGFYGRYEGFLTYIVVTIFAYLYWQTCETWLPLVLAIGVLGVMLPFLSSMIPPNTFEWLASPPVAQSAMFAVATAILYSIHRSFVIVTISGLVNAGMRSGVIAALAGCLAYELLTRSWSWNKKAAWRTLAASVAVFAVLTLSMHHSKLWTKLKATSFDFTGSRSQWVVQVDDIARLYMPLTGFGLDTGSEILQPATGKTHHAGAIADRAHNVLSDMLLWTGWPGLACAILIFAYAVALTWTHRTFQNVTCMAGLTAFVVYGFINPLGIPALFLMGVCVFGFEDQTDEGFTPAHELPLISIK